MKPQSRDTSPEVEEILIEGFRRMSAAEKLERIQALGPYIRNLQLDDIRRRHPDADERECELRLASRRLPPELMRKAFGWDPDIEGY